MATSYANSGGTGNRTALITVVVTGGYSGTPSHLVNGVTSEFVGWMGFLTTHLEFQFLAPKVIDEAKFYQSDATAHGTWKWQGSPDGAVWTDLGGSFTLGGSATQTQTSLAGNTTAYVRYRLALVSGSASSGPYLYEFEFKIGDAPAAPTPARVTQAVVETLSAALVVATPARVTQALVEVLAENLPPPPAPIPSDVTQVAVEAFVTQAGAARTTQQVVELFETRAAAVRVTQTVVEVFLTDVPAAPREPVRRYIRRLRRAPHVQQEHTRIAYARFALDLQRGVGLVTGQGSDPLVTLRLSRDGGKTWGEPVTMRAGRLGAYTTRVLARRLGQARDAVFEVTVSDPVAWSLVQAWLDLEPGSS